MSNNKGLYPDFYPEGCPPVDAEPMEIEVYRLIKGATIDNTDFKSFFELNLDIRSLEFPFIEYGISVNTCYEELKRYWRSNGALKKKFSNIGGGITFEKIGVIKPTPSKAQNNHYTWWLLKEAEPEKYFIIK